VQLVGDWVSRGLLVPSQRGFRLRDGADAEQIPDGLLQVWEDHVLRLLRARSEEDAQALELAATLGLELRQIDFRVLCVLGKLKPSPDLIAELMRRRLAQPVGERDQRWAFSHGMLREVLQRRARQGGRWAGHNKVCANHLRAARQVDQERLARHLLDAGELAEALGPLSKAIGDRLARGDYRSSSLLTEQEEALRALGIPETDPRWGEVWLSWAWLLRARGQYADAERWTVRTERAARRHGWQEQLGRALRLGARIERNLGRTEEALGLAREAEQLFRDNGDLRRAADARTLVGDLYLSQGRLDEAQHSFESALASRTGDDEVDAWMGLATCAQRRADPDRLAERLEKAREAATRAGRRNALAAIANLEGELARQRGDLELAEERYREASARLKALDDATYIYSQLNLGLLLVLREAWQEATVLIEPVLERAEQGGVRSIPACFARAVLLPCAAGLEEWADFKEHYRWLKDFLASRKLVDRDIARMAKLAADLAAKAGRRDAEAAALLIAVPQYVELKDTEAEQATRARLRALGREA
ncbi:MAG: hypothetical protein KC621_12335, partial [Myxococcales bacterium]|nr:hypothetical protein [Myxococcales bacterium]